MHVNLAQQFCMNENKTHYEKLAKPNNPSSAGNVRFVRGAPR